VNHLDFDGPMFTRQELKALRLALSTDLLNTEPIKPGYLARDVEVLGFRAFPRVCAMCIDQPTPRTASVRHG
jgi:hypothetical protein